MCMGRFVTILTRLSSGDCERRRPRTKLSINDRTSSVLVVRVRTKIDQNRSCGDLLLLNPGTRTLIIVRLCINKLIKRKYTTYVRPNNTEVIYN